MTPEEKFNQQVLEVLQKIKEESLATEKNKPVVFRIGHVQGVGIIPKERKINILFKLQEWKALKLRDDPFEAPIPKDNEIYLDLLQPRFNEIYRLYESGSSFEENEKKITAPKKSSIIKPKTLELISKIIGELDSGPNLMAFLTNCGVNEALIEYPQTKWRMINKVLLILATSGFPGDLNILYKVIEESCHPLTFDGDEAKAKEITDKFNSLLKYDDIYLNEGRIHIKSSYPFDDEWVRSDGVVIEPGCSTTDPIEVASLYVFWNELIKITKLYLSNPNKHTDELNELYFEIIWAIEKTLKKEQCGTLHKRYVRPFSNLIGCEYEVKKMGKVTDDVMKNLYAFFGEITATSLPILRLVEEAKKENKGLLGKIESYIKNHSAVKSADTEGLSKYIQPIPIHIVGGQIGIDGLREGFNSVAQNKKENKYKFPYKIPAGTRWENFTLKFEGEENILIKVKQLKHHTNFKEMGLIGKGNNPNPSEAWTLLKVLSQRNGELAIGDPKAKAKYKKQKELLTKSLQNYFSLDYDPFYPYASSPEKSGDSYKIKMTLIPSIKGEGVNKEVVDEDTLGINEFIEEEAPSVYTKD